MAFDPWTVGATLLAGHLDRQAADDFNRSQREEDYRTARMNLRQQRVFAKNSINWRVNDAIRAGIHPLAALGVQATPFTPIHGGGGNQVYTGDSKSDAIRAVLDSREAESRTRLNNAQADMLETQARDSAIARMAQDPNTDKFHNIVDPQRTPRLKIGGIPVKTFEGSTDAQTFEDRYGELGGSALGLLNIPADALNTIIDAVVNSEIGQSTRRALGSRRDYLR